ncbi:endothelin-converting enzyme 1-like [Rhipicephalus sanguineus]|uniref:endothelin-converting enzyme 1-like n=1 Tax=Rhipicephalus sanguineus TaxID=34632 RepID=UPI0020C42D04|nr:endothelin-converting enzyme 1-like [Rhipicephalus sanguineus]
MDDKKKDEEALTYTSFISFGRTLVPAAPPVPPQTSAVNKGDRKASATGIIRSSLSSRRKGSTGSEKRAVVYPPVRKMRPSAPAEPRGPGGPDTGSPPEQEQPDFSLPGEQQPSLTGVSDSLLSPGTSGIAAFYNNQMTRGSRPSLERRSSRRSSLQRFRRRRSSSLLRRRGSWDSLTQRPYGPAEQLSVSVGKRSVSSGTMTCVVFVFVMVLLVLTMYIANQFLKPPFVADRRVCATDDCVRHALHILRTLNTSADPCLDFHAYVCGSGDGKGGEAQSGNSGKDPDERIGSIDEIDPAWRLARLYTYQVNNILGNLHQLVTIKRTSETTLKALVALSLCLQRERKRHSNAFAAFMKQRKLPWPANSSEHVALVDVVDVLLDLSINWRVSIWVDVRLWHMETRPDMGPVVVLDEPGHVPLIRMEQVSTLNDTEYASAVERTAQFIGEVGESSDTATRGFQDSVAIDQLKRDETDFREAILSALRGGDSYDTLIPLHALRLTRNITLDEWTELLRKYLAPAGLNVTIDTALLILRYPHVKTLTGMMNKISPPRLLNVLGWMLAYSYSWLDNAEFDVLSDQGGPGSGSLSGNGLFVHVLCFVAVHESFGPALEVALLLDRLPSEERLKVTEIVNATAGALVEAVRGSPSVSTSTKADAEKKISLVASRDLWTPKPLLNLSRLDALYTYFPSMRARNFYASWLELRKALRVSLPNRYHGTVMTAKLMRYAGDILYLYSLNMLFLNIPAVFPPKYLSDGNSIMAYAGLGFQLLRQIVRTVDERGRQVEHATAKKSWWEENRVCKINEAESASERREIKDLFALELTSKVAQSSAAVDRKPPRLKHLEKLTAVQTFYVSYCSHFCGEIGEQSMCNLAMNNSEFAHAFACQWRGTQPGCIFF